METLCQIKNNETRRAEVRCPGPGHVLAAKMINDKLFKERWQQIKQQRATARQVEYLRAFNVFKMLLRVVRQALDGPQTQNNMKNKTK